MPQQQLLHHHAGLDGLTQTNIIGQQQIGTWSGKCTAQRLELIWLEIRTRTERCLKFLRIGAGDRAPTHRVHKRTQTIRIIKGIGIDDVGKPLVRKNGLAYLQLPNDRELFTHAVFLKRLQRHDMLLVATALIGRTAGDPLPSHIGNGPGRTTYLNDAAHFRQCRNPCRFNAFAHQSPVLRPSDLRRNGWIPVYRRIERIFVFSP